VRHRAALHEHPTPAAWDTSCTSSACGRAATVRLTRWARRTAGARLGRTWRTPGAPPRYALVRRAHPGSFGGRRSSRPSGHRVRSAARHRYQAVLASGHTAAHTGTWTSSRSTSTAPRPWQPAYASPVRHPLRHVLRAHAAQPTSRGRPASSGDDGRRATAGRGTTEWAPSGRLPGRAVRAAPACRRRATGRPGTGSSGRERELELHCARRGRPGAAVRTGARSEWPGIGAGRAARGHPGACCHRRRPRPAVTRSGPAHLRGERAGGAWCTFGLLPAVRPPESALTRRRRVDHPDRRRAASRCAGGAERAERVAVNDQLLIGGAGWTGCAPRSGTSRGAVPPVARQCDFYAGRPPAEHPRRRSPTSGRRPPGSPWPTG